MKKKLMSGLLAVILTLPGLAGGLTRKEFGNDGYKPEEVIFPEETEAEPSEYVSLEVPPNEEPKDSPVGLVQEAEICDTLEQGTDEEVNLDRYEMAAQFSEDELVAMCIEAEAGNQSILGKRLVADAIYNRCDMEEFPDTVTDVILQDNAFQVVTKGTIWKNNPSESTLSAMEMEKDRDKRVETDVVYFQTEEYSQYGYPYEHVGDHYFSTQHEQNYVLGE